MKRNKLMCGLLSVTMAFSVAAMGVAAEENVQEVCTQEQCETIVETAVEQYKIEVPTVEEYKAYIWEMVQEDGLSAEQLEKMLKESYKDAAERKALNDARAADTTINSAKEAKAALDEINKEEHTCYNLGVGPFAEKADYLDTLQLNKEAFKAQVKEEVANGVTNGIVGHLGIEDYNEKIPAVSPRSVREDISQQSTGILMNEKTGDNTVVKGYLNSKVFSVSGNPGSFTYENIKSYGVSSYGSARNGSCSLSGGSGRHTAVIIASGYIGVIFVTGQIPFSAG